jgi:peptide/nickel transport system substrate-binding protein
MILSQVVDTLVRADAHGNIRPYLAQRYQISADGRAVTFFLHRAIEFSNGDPLDANAVKFTIDRAINPATRSFVGGALVDIIKSTAVIDPSTVRLVLKHPYRPLFSQLGYPTLGILDPRVANATSPDPCNYPIGSGPFKVESVGPDFSTVTLVRNPLHTLNPSIAAHQGPAYLDRIVWKPIVSDTTATSELLTGGTDVDLNVAGAQLGRVQGSARIRLYPVPALGETFLGFNLSHPPFDRPDVRRAVAEAIDRAALIKAAADGLGLPAYSPLPSTLPFYDPQARSYAPRYSPSAAHRVIAAAHAGGPYTLLLSVRPEYSVMAELIQAELAQVGMGLQVSIKPQAAYLSLAAKGQFDLYILGWRAQDADFLYYLFHSSQETGAGLNFSFYHNARLDNLLVQGRTAANPATAARIYARVQRLIDEQVIVDPLFIDYDTYAARTRIHGWHQDHQGWPLYQDLYLGS